LFSWKELYFVSSDKVNKKSPPDTKNYQKQPENIELSILRHPNGLLEPENAPPKCPKRL
jgi:hypothetical protein